jgi:hypothetical protein
MKKFIGFMVLAFWVVGGLLLTPGISLAQVQPPGIQIFDNDANAPGITANTSGFLFSSNLVITQEVAGGGPGSVIWDFTYSSSRQVAETFSYNIFEQGGTTLSDTLRITLAPQSGPVVLPAIGHLEFFSGPLNDTPLLTPLSNAFSITETGSLQDLLVAGIPHPTDMFVLGFQSDLDAPPSVPEPASLLFLGLGLVGLAGVKRREESA